MKIINTINRRNYMRAYWPLYAFMIPALIFTVIFKLTPLYGMLIAFKDYSMFNGSNPINAIANSDFVGFDNFIKVVREPGFIQAVVNTFIIGALKLLFLFPLPILMAILLNEISHKFTKQFLQTVLYLPHFFSWVVVAGIFMNMLSGTGLLNTLLIKMGLNKVNFLMAPQYFRSVLVFSDAWKETGFSAIVYIAAISSINITLYEAAEVDGAGKLKQMWYITLPSLIPSIVIMFILKTGKMLEENFQQILVMYNPVVYDVADVIQTYVYRLGMGQMDYTLGVTVGLFNSVVSFLLILFSNQLCKLLTGQNAL